MVCEDLSEVTAGSSSVMDGYAIAQARGYLGYSGYSRHLRYLGIQYLHEPV